MNTELECKFVNQDHDKIRAKLKKLGAKLVHKERLMVRANYDYPDYRLAKEQNGWVRIRDEGDKITLSYKQSDDSTLHGMQEVNLQINSFESAHDFLNAIGITNKKAYQETKRESWLLDDVQIELDTWPWLKPFIGLEAPNEVALNKALKALGYNKKDALHGSVIPAYQAEYDIAPGEMSNWPEYRFDLPVPDWLESRRKK